jgi:predicted RecA/RadA family phage recombinase
MTDKMRWRYGDTNPVIAAVDALTVIEIGDLLWQDVDDAKPASLHHTTGDKPTRQAAFTQKFLGVAVQRSRMGESSPIRVATTGVFEMDCPASTYELGDLVGIETNASQSALLNQSVVKGEAGAAGLAIGRVARRAPAPAQTVLVDIRSTVMTGGV